jgi:hypothetical protein
LGPGYTLLRFDRTIDIAALRAAAERRGVPLASVDIAADEAGNAYAEKLVLVRPDQHIAWRGMVEPVDCDALIARITGAAGVASEARPAAAVAV